MRNGRLRSDPGLRSWKAGQPPGITLRISGLPRPSTAESPLRLLLTFACTARLNFSLSPDCENCYKVRVRYCSERRIDRPERCCCKDTQARPKGQNVPRAHRSSCAPFLPLNKCLPPFEARLASSFAAAGPARITMHPAARMHRGRPPNPKHAGWTGKFAVG